MIPESKSSMTGLKINGYGEESYLMNTISEKSKITYPPKKSENHYVRPKVTDSPCSCLPECRVGSGCFCP